MSREILLRAAAKVNLSLKVLARLDNSYHYLNSLIVRIDLHDEIRLALLEDRPGEIELSCSFSEQLRRHQAADLANIKLISSQENIACRAAGLFLEHFSLTARFAVKIELIKNIPFGAGLGGGSADAAAVIAGLCALSAVEPSTKEVIELAAKLGADVPALLFKRAVLIERLGEQVFALERGDGEALEGLGSLPCLLVKPSFPINTAVAYRALSKKRGFSQIPSFSKLERHESLEKILRILGLSARALYDEQTPYNYLTFLGDADSSAGRKTGPSGQVLDCLALFENDFEEVVFAEQSVEYAEILARLRALGSTKILLAGSGSSLVAFMPSSALAQRAADEAGRVFSESTFVLPTRVFF